MERVLLEEQSRTTYENLLFSKAIGQARIDKPRFLFVTNDYHVLRTSLYARRAGLVGDGLATTFQVLLSVNISLFSLKSSGS